MTALELIKLLNKVDPHAVVWASGDFTFPIEYVVKSTAGDPATGRCGGDPTGKPVVMLMDRHSHKKLQQNRRKYRVPNDVTRVVGHDQERT